MGNSKEKQKYTRERNTYSEVFWDNVEEIMEQRKPYVTWTNLSMFLGTDRTTVASMRTRRSRLTLDTVVHVSDFLNVPIDQLLNRDNVVSHDWSRLQMTEEELNMLMLYRSLRSYGKGESAKRIIFTVLEELKG